MEREPVEIQHTSYHFEKNHSKYIEELYDRVTELRNHGKLNAEALTRIRKYFKIKNIYNSNAIEGNKLTVGETREVVERGLTLTGASLKDQAEAKNLSEALDFLEELAKESTTPITEHDIRQLHYFVLKGINDENAGKYRTVEVEISGSQFKPTPCYKLSSEMAEFTSWLREHGLTGNRDSLSANPVIIAAVAHTWFVMIHPFIDGNGRTARLLMNLILMRFGYPIAIINKDDRLRYYDALEEAQTSDLTPFISLISECIHESLEEYESALSQQIEHQEWAKSLAEKFDHKQQLKARNQYEIWKNAMELLKSTFNQTVSIINENVHLAKIYFSDFGILEFEKYLSLLSSGSAKKTWFFRLDFKNDSKVIRYLFFFSAPSNHLKHNENIDVSLAISREEPAGSFQYERLEYINNPNTPDFYEIAYSAKEERFLIRRANNQVQQFKIEPLAKDFFEDVISKHFSN